MNIKYFKKLVLITIVFCLLILVSVQSSAQYLTTAGQVIHEKFWAPNSYLFGHLMEKTIYQTPIFHFDSKQKGPVVLIIGGTHGNEAAGFEAVHRLLEQFSKNGIKQGEIFLIPEANKLAVDNNKRRIPVPADVDIEKGNLNRCYPGDLKGLPMEKEAYEIAGLIKNNNINLVLDLHESRKLHMETVKPDGSYSGLGQTLIFTPDEDAAWLGMIVLDQLNGSIDSEQNQFSMVERPIKNSTAWMAGEIFGIPGFTVETYRGLPLADRIRYHVQIVNIILKEKGMI